MYCDRALLNYFQIVSFEIKKKFTAFNYKKVTKTRINKCLHEMEVSFGSDMAI